MIFYYWIKPLYSRFIRHILNYTEYNQQWNESGPLHGHKRIYINIYIKPESRKRENIEFCGQM